MQARAALAVFEDLVRQLRLVFDNSKAELEEEIRNARKQANGLNAMFFRFVDESAENASACTLTFRFRLYYDRAHLGKMRSVKVQRAASEKHSAIGLGDGEIAHVLADFRERTLQERAIT